MQIPRRALSTLGHDRLPRITTRGIAMSSTYCLMERAAGRTRSVLRRNVGNLLEVHEPSVWRLHVRRRGILVRFPELAPSSADRLRMRAITCLDHSLLSSLRIIAPWNSADIDQRQRSAQIHCEDTRGSSRLEGYSPRKMTHSRCREALRQSHSSPGRTSSAGSADVSVGQRFVGGARGWANTPRIPPRPARLISQTDGSAH